ncbi:MAG: DUF5647 family protein [Planctomycetota bacterium]|jgi:hypothetical protein
MIDMEHFARRQMELTSEFAKYVMEHPEVDEMLPEDSYVYFQLEGEPGFNEHSRKLAQRREREEGMAPVCVRVKGLAPPQGSRLIDPEIVTTPT